MCTKKLFSGKMFLVKKKILCEIICFLAFNWFCRGSIRDGLATIMGSYEKRAQTISFVECGFEKLGLGHRTVAWFGPVNESHPRSLRSFGL